MIVKAWLIKQNNSLLIIIGGLLVLVIIFQIAIFILLLDKPMDSKPYTLTSEHNNISIQSVSDFNAIFVKEKASWDVALKDRDIKIETFKPVKE